MGPHLGPMGPRMGPGSFLTFASPILFRLVANLLSSKGPTSAHICGCFVSFRKIAKDVDLMSNAPGVRYSYLGIEPSWDPISPKIKQILSGFKSGVLVPKY